jgi:hypothetical protein
MNSTATGHTPLRAIVAVLSTVGGSLALGPLTTRES